MNPNTGVKVKENLELIVTDAGQEQQGIGVMLDSALDYRPGALYNRVIFLLGEILMSVYVLN